MMDAMISRCVDELNEQDEEVKRIRMQQDPKAWLVVMYCTCSNDNNFLVFIVHFASLYVHVYITHIEWSDHVTCCHGYHSDAPSYSIPTGGQSVSPSKNYLEDKLICEVFDNTTG